MINGYTSSADVDAAASQDFQDGAAYFEAHPNNEFEAHRGTADFYHGFCESRNLSGKKNMTATYEAALNKSNIASRAFGLVQVAYRTRKIGDAEYLAARAVYEKSVAEFDAAFAAEAVINEKESNEV